MLQSAGGDVKRASASVEAPAVSIIVPTRDRQRHLQDCLEAIRVSVLNARCSVEVIVVDDGSAVPVRTDAFPSSLDAVLVRLEGNGPAAARNAGLRRARGAIALFTDDDTLPAPSWIAAASGYLDERPAAVGVEGPVCSKDWDPLFEDSVRTAGPGHYYTCNIAYRREALISIGGFSDHVFRYAHAEDRDLGARALCKGPIGFTDAMTVEHSPRSLTMSRCIRRGKWVRDDIALYALHPDMTRDFRLPTRVAVVWGNSSQWIGWAASGRPRSAHRWVRGVSIAAATGVVAVWSALTTPRVSVIRRRFDEVERPRVDNV